MSTSYNVRGAASPLWGLWGLQLVTPMCTPSESIGPLADAGSTIHGSERGFGRTLPLRFTPS